MSAPKSDNSPQPTEPESTSAAGEPAGETASPRDAGEREEASSTTPARVSEEVAEHTRSGPVEGSEGASTKVSVADDDGDSSSKEAAGASVEAAPASPEEAESAESPSSLEPASPQSVNEGPEPAGAEQVDGSSAAFGSDSPEAAEGSAAASGSDSPDADDASDTTPLDRTEVDRASESTSRLPARIELRYAGATAVGLVREHNEDNLLMANLTTSKRSPRHQTCVDHVGSRGSIFAVCDGMGGAAAGEVASQLAVDTVFEELSDLQGSEDRDAFAQALISTVERAGRRIFQTAKEDHSRQGMGTTATVAGLVDQVLFVAQVGDSRAYLLRHGEFKRITKDQSLVNQLIEAGHLTVEEAEAFEHSNIILQALGTTEAVQVDLTFAELRRGDRLLLCSDGLCGLVNDDAVAHTITTVDDPSECCGKLIDQANAAGGHDNITVIVADFEGEALVKPKPTDTVGYVQYPLPAETGPGSPGDEVEFDEPTVAEPIGRRSREQPSGAGRVWVLAGVLSLLVGLLLFGLDSGESSRGGPSVEQSAPARPAGRPPETPDSGIAVDLPGKAPARSGAQRTFEVDMPAAVEEAKPAEPSPERAPAHDPAAQPSTSVALGHSEKEKGSDSPQEAGEVPPASVRSRDGAFEDERRARREVAKSRKAKRGRQGTDQTEHSPIGGAAAPAPRGVAASAEAVAPPMSSEIGTTSPSPSTAPDPSRTIPENPY